MGAGVPGQQRPGSPAIHGLLLLNDPATVPTAILDAGPITAERTAAVSGVAIRAFAPAATAAGRSARRSSAPASRAGATCRCWGTCCRASPSRSSTGTRPAPRPLRLEARETEGIGSVRVAGSARDAVEGAGVVVTAASFAPPAERQVMTNDWLEPSALVVPVDYATYCAAAVAREAALFAVDHTAQFLANRDAGNFDGYPDPPR